MSFLKRTKRICPFLSAQKKRTKRKHHPPKALPQGRDATAPTRRSFIKVCSDHQRSGMNCLNGGIAPKPLKTFRTKRSLE